MLCIEKFCRLIVFSKESEFCRELDRWVGKMDTVFQAGVYAGSYRRQALILPGTYRKATPSFHPSVAGQAKKRPRVVGSVLRPGSGLFQ